MENGSEEAPQVKCREETERSAPSEPSEVVSGNQRIDQGMKPQRGGGRGRGRGRGRSGGGPSMVGSYVQKNFADGAGTLLGKVVSYGGRFFAAVYEDGRTEELDACEIRRLLVLDAVGDASEVEELRLRKRKLEDMVSAPGTSTRTTRRKVETAATTAIAVTEVPAVEVSEGRSGATSVDVSGLDVEEDADSSSDSCESISAPACAPASSQLVPLQVIPLPPSSGDIAIPEESVVCLLSVYNFLRSFSLQLFLSPFGLAEFVGSLNCTVQNSLLDSIHVTLMRTLRRHLEILSSEGSEFARRCLRCYDWAMLDSLTWPVFLLEYLQLAGHIKGRKWEGFHYGIADGEYYGLSSTIKLKILQILCDAVVESEEIRTELAARENMDEERECTSNVSFPAQTNMKRAHSRYSQRSYSRDVERNDNAISPEESTSSSNRLPNDANEPDVTQDGNSDECQLCGMDGILVCCDGCPSAYHSRCIGLTKAFLPEGSWFCPECMANKIGPTFSKIGTGIRGADMFGIDPHGRVFLGSCNYLLVFDTSISTDAISRYYNPSDVLKVLKLLSAAAQCSPIYADICKGIVNYWAVPVDTSCFYPETLRMDSTAGILVPKGDFGITQPSCVPIEKTTANENAGGNNASNLTLNSQENRALSNTKGNFTEVLANDSLDSVNQADQLSTLKFPREINEISADKLTENVNSSAYADHMKLHKQIESESVLSFGFFGQPSNMSDLNQQKSAEKSSMLDLGWCVSQVGNVAFRDDADSQVLKGTAHISLSSESAKNNHIRVVKIRVQSNESSALGAIFKPQAYVNQYVLGEIAAFAAANFTALALEESKSAVHSSYSHRKAVSTDTSLQLKAFSKVTTYFMWTNYEKKQMEVPRERCGWCIACKGANTNKKGCLLNLAAANAMKAVVKGHGSHRPLKNIESQVFAISTHILNMEENLHGLIVGPLAEEKHNKLWRMSLKEASTFRTVKLLLLELERNIRGVTFSGDWFKLLDDSLVDFSTAQVSTAYMVPMQKRGPGRRRKHPIASERLSSSDNEIGDHVNWWRGGQVSRALFQRAILPSLLSKRAARQGGMKYISGISYSESFAFPRRNQQFAWRTAVEMSKSASQLAFQVRCLDAHIRWKDLVRPEQVSLEGKAAENEASAFRNAIICEKKTIGNKIRYALVFGEQKHLPTRVTKNVLEVEETEDGKDKLWFLESNIPLYLIKEYENTTKNAPLAPKVITHCLPAFQRRQLKLCRKDIFSYLLQKEEKPSKCSCASCHHVVLQRDAVRCNACQGYCHKTCLIPSSVCMEVNLDFSSTCKRCNISLHSSFVENQEENIYGQLSFQENPISKKMEQYYNHPTQQLQDLNPDLDSDLKQPSCRTVLEQKSKRGTCLSYGLKWKKKKDSVESGEEFRRKHIIKRDSADPQRKPICVLCSKPYNPDAMYICCEKCSSWVHADAVLLEEDKVLDLIGYRCCKCRRKSSPNCPYADSDKMAERKPLKGRYAEDQNMLEPLNSVLSDGGHLLSTRRVNTVSQFPSGVGSLKLIPTALQRQHLGGFCENIRNNSLHSSGRKTEAQELCSTQGFGQMVIEPPQVSFSSHENWNVPGSGNLNGMFEECANTKGLRDGSHLDSEELNFEDMESEPPQTFFSFTELLASGDEQLDQLLEIPIDNVTDGWCGDDTAALGLDYESNVTEERMAAMAETATMPPVAGVADHRPLAVDHVPCQRCGANEPPAELTCEGCGLSVHHGCLPWGTETDMAASSGVPWKCVNCREWE